MSEFNDLFIIFNSSKISLMQKLCSHLDVDNSPYGTTEDIYYYIDNMQNYINHNKIYLYVNIYEIELRKKLKNV